MSISWSLLGKPVGTVFHPVMYESYLGLTICRQNWESHWRDERVKEVFGNSQFEKEVTENARLFLDASHPVIAPIGFMSRFACDYIKSAFDSIL